MSLPMRVDSRAVAVLALCTWLAGCAGVNFYSDPGLTKPTGIPIYGARPYLLVSRTGAEDKPVETSIVYITDPEKVIYADPKSGFGTAKLSLTLAGGQLTAFGQETDTKIPELLAQVSGLITARAGAAKTMAEAAAAAAAAGGSTKQSTLSETDAAQRVQDIANAMDAAAKANSLKDLTPAERKVVDTAIVQLRQASAVLRVPANKPLAPDQYEIVKAQAAAMKKLPAPTASTPRDAALQLVQAWARDLQKIFEATQPEAPKQATFELYEIVQRPGMAPTLRPVVVP